MSSILTPENLVNKRFKPTKFRSGYSMDEVDDFLDEVVVELRRLASESENLQLRIPGSETRLNTAVPTITPEDVINKTFPATKFREGYDQDEVDDFLDEIVETLREIATANDKLRAQVA